MPGKCSEVFERAQLWDSHLESTQLLTPGAARSQPSLEGERGRLTALVFLWSEDDSSDTVLSFRAVANSELLLSCGIVQQLGNCVGMWMGRSWESCSRAPILSGKHLPPLLPSLPSQQPCWAGQSCAELFLIQGPEKGLVPSDTKQAGIRQGFITKWFKGSLSLLFSPSLKSLSCPAKSPVSVCLGGFQGTTTHQKILKFSCLTCFAQY